MSASFYHITESSELNIKKGPKHTHWRGHQTSPTVVSLKGRLPKIMQHKSTLSCDVIQIHSPFRHGFIKKPKSNFNEIENRRILF